MLDRIASVQPILEGAPIEIAILFGSSARGTARPDSDVDIAIVPTEEMSLRDRLDLGVALERTLGRDVDLVVLGPDSPSVLRLEVAKGRPLYERSRGAFADFVTRALFAQDDLRPHLRRAARAHLAGKGGRPGA